MDDNQGRLIMINGVLRLPEQVNINSFSEQIAIYEVLRVMEGIPLFFEDHYARLLHSIHMQGVGLDISADALMADIKRLVAENNEQYCNVKLIFYVGQDLKKMQDVLIYVSKSHYPSQEEVATGRVVSLFRWERNNPNAKVLIGQYKQAVARAINDNHVFEVLLVNDNDRITEGSRSNLFFVKGRKVITAPGAMILMGITRKYILEVCKALDLEVVEEALNVEALCTMEGLFISGTSIKVLPISKVNDLCFASATNPIIADIRNGFDVLMEQYIRQRLHV